MATLGFGLWQHPDGTAAIRLAAVSCPARTESKASDVLRAKAKGSLETLRERQRSRTT